nr:hypothetical protein [Tanacetum cinerariifolium]
MKLVGRKGEDEDAGFLCERVRKVVGSSWSGGEVVRSELQVWREIWVNSNRLNVGEEEDRPSGFQDLEFLHRVYKVEKAMYGLHQALRAWKHKGEFLLVQVYINDIIFGTSNPKLCREFKALMHDKFQISAMGELNFFLGLKVLQKKDGIFLLQDKYVGDILKIFRYTDIRFMIGSLMYLTASRPDIMFVVCACARHQVTPKNCHLYVVKRIFRYLKGHPMLGLWYPKESPFDLVAYSDNDYGGANQDRKSTTRDDNVADLLPKAFDVGRFQYLVAFLVCVRCAEAFGCVIIRERTHTAKTFDLVWMWYGGNSGNSANGLNKDPVCLSPKSTSFNEFSSNIATALVCLATNRTYNFSKMIFDGMMRNVKNETVFPTRDVRYGEAFPTVTSLDAGQDRENIAKTSAIPHEASPRVTSLGGVKTLEDNEKRREGFAQEDAPNIEGIDQGEDLLVGDTVKDSDKSADKRSDSTDEMANVLGTLGSVNILASRGLRLVFITASLSVATSSIVFSPDVATTSGSFLTAAIFTTASVATPNTIVTRSSRGVVIKCSSLISVNIPFINKKDKGKGKVTEPKQPNQIIRKQDERDSEIARIHAESELEMMIAELDMSNEIVAKYLSEYEQAEVGLSHDEKVKLIDELLMYQRTLAQVKKYQAQKISQLQRLKEEISTSEASGIEPTQEQRSEEPKELSEEELKEMMELVPVEELYEALQVKYPIIDLEIYSEGQRKYWKIIRVRNHTEVYQIFDDMLKKFDQEDLDRL